MKAITITMVMTYVITLLLLGCKADRAYVGKMHSVVVFHSWADKGEEGKPFRNMMEEAFESFGVHAHVHHIYMNMLNQSAEFIDSQLWDTYSDSLDVWKPEIILVNDDPAFDWIVSGHHDDYFRKIPIVFAGVNTLDTDVLQDYMNLTGLEDKIDIVANLNMIADMLGEKTAIIELDNFNHDQQLRTTIKEQLKKHDQFIDNSDFHLEQYSSVYIDSAYSDKMCVMMVSGQHPLQLATSRDRQQTITEMKHLMKHAKDYIFLQVKYDMYSNMFQDRSGRPMFTCIREQFNNPNETRILGGYFTDTRTQIYEQVQYAIDIIENNIDPFKMPISVHDKKYFIDHNAITQFKEMKGTMKVLSGIDDVLIKGWGERYTIINTPFFMNNRRYWIIGSIISLFLAVTLITWIIKKIRKRLKAYKDKLNDEVKTELNMRRHILADADSTVWKSSQNTIEFPREFAKQHGIKRRFSITEFEKHIHPDYLKEWEKLKNYRNDLGRRKVRLRIKFDQGTDWHWYDIIYNVTTEASFRWELNGLVVCVDEVMEQKQQLLEAVSEAKEIKLKNRFLVNFKHILKEPLKVVLTNARAIISPSIISTSQQMEEYNAELHRGANELIQNIDSLVADSKEK